MRVSSRVFGGLGACFFAFVLQNCGGDTQVIQVVQPMGGGSGVVGGTGGTDNVGKVGTGGNSVIPMSGGVPSSNVGGASTVGTGGAASGGAPASVGAGGSAELGGTASMGGAQAQSGGAATGGAVNTGGTGGGVPTMTEAECKLGRPISDGNAILRGCQNQSGDFMFAWGGHCYWLQTGNASWEEANSRCSAQGQGWALAALNCAEEHSYISQMLLTRHDNSDVAIGGIHADFSYAGGPPPLNGWSWTNGDPWEYTPPFAASWNGDGPYNCMNLLAALPSGEFNQVQPGNRAALGSPRTSISYLCERPLQ